MAIAGIWAGKRNNIPVIFDMAEDYVAMIRDIWEARKFKGLNFLIRNPYLVKIVEKYVLSKVDHIFVVVEEAKKYSAERADIALRLHALLKPALIAAKRITVYETLERPLVTALAEMEHAGIKVDQSFLAKLSNDFAKEMDRLEALLCSFLQAQPSAPSLHIPWVLQGRQNS